MIFFHPDSMIVKHKTFSGKSRYLDLFVCLSRVRACVIIFLCDRAKVPIEKRSSVDTLCARCVVSCSGK